MKILEEEVARYKVTPFSFRRLAGLIIVGQHFNAESKRRYRKEQELILGALHDLGMLRTRDHLGTLPNKQGRSGPNSSWLAQQRKNVSLPMSIRVGN